MDPFMPRDKSLLRFQDRHRSSIVWKEQETHLLTCRRREASLRRVAGVHLDPRILAYVEAAGFAGITRLKFIQLDWHLITALVERWRQETHSFHMPHGEMTITLQDVQILFGLRVDGDVVTGRTNLSVTETCERYLGVAPDRTSTRGSRIKMTWLASVFQQLNDVADDETVRRYARAYILQLIGGILFPDKSGNLVNVMWLPLLKDFNAAGRFSWGSACLGWLYRQLCRATHIDAEEIGGNTILLQLWAWERFPHIAKTRRRITLEAGCPLACRWQTEFDTTQQPTHVISSYRLALDQQTSHKVIWQPYSEETIGILPASCSVGREIWLARVPLICFNIVEHYYPNRVMRQFGGRQGIPDPVDTDERLHNIDLGGRINRWDKEHAHYIGIWQERRNRIINLDIYETIDDSVTPDYIPWYYSISRRFMVIPGGIIGRYRETMESIVQFANQPELRTWGENMMREQDRLEGFTGLMPVEPRRTRRRGRQESPHLHGETLPLFPERETPPLSPRDPRSPSSPCDPPSYPTCTETVIHSYPMSTRSIPSHTDSSHFTDPLMLQMLEMPIPSHPCTSVSTLLVPQKQCPSVDEGIERQVDPMMIEVGQQSLASTLTLEAASHITKIGSLGLQQSHTTSSTQLPATSLSEPQPECAPLVTRCLPRKAKKRKKK